MTALIDRFTVRTLTRQFTDFVVAYLVVLIAYGGEISGPTDVVATAQVILAIKLHIFSLPLAWTPVFGQIPLWGWYVVVVMWLVRFAARSGYTTEEIVAKLEDAYYALPETTEPDREPAVTDGGGPDR